MSDVVSVGQVWTYGSLSYKITAIIAYPGGYDVFAYNMSDMQRSPILFGCLDANGSRQWGANWQLANVEPLKQTAVKKPLSRECPCGIFRGDCDYHRS